MTSSYETSKVAGLYGGSVVCEDCGAVVVDEKAHDRSHAIQGDVARSVAILTVAHLSQSVHDRYEAYDKIWKGRNRNNWSDEAFTEVTGLPAQNETATVVSAAERDRDTYQGWRYCSSCDALVRVGMGHDCKADHA